MVKDLVDITGASTEVGLPVNVISVVTMAIWQESANSYPKIVAFVEIQDTEIQIVHFGGSKELYAAYVGTLVIKPVNVL